VYVPVQGQVTCLSPNSSRKLRMLESNCRRK
jgi:hypothetical protein